MAIMDSGTATLLQILKERVNELLEGGNLDEAIHAASAAVDKVQQMLCDDPDTASAYGDALELRAELFRKAGRLDEALDDYHQAIMVLEERPGHEAQLGRLHAGLGAAHDSGGRPESAAKHWTTAVEWFERMDSPAVLDVAAMCNNLAYLRREAGDLEQAETYFLKALEITHRELGPKHAETALLWNNLGACYQAAGYHEQAREMHLMALAARLECFGENHPDTAQSHNNLALAVAVAGAGASATEHFEKSLAAFEAAGDEYREDLLAVAANFAEFLRQQGDDTAAAAVESRIGLPTSA